MIINKNNSHSFIMEKCIVYKSFESFYHVMTVSIHSDIKTTHTKSKYFMNNKDIDLYPEDNGSTP